MNSRRATLHYGLIALALGFTPDAEAAFSSGSTITGGTITATNDQAKTFTCDWKGKNWTFRTTDTTAFWIGKTRGSLSDLKSGAVVDVKYHPEHGELLADTVRVQASK